MKTIRAKMIMALIVPLVVLVPVAAVTLSATNSSHRTSEAVERSADILQGAQRLVLAAVDSETGLRGYIITADEAFLEPYNAGKANFDAQSATLRKAVVDDALQSARLEKVLALELQWRSQIAEPEIAEVRENRLEAATAKVHSGQGKALKDQVRAADAEFVGAERAIFDRRIAANDRAVTRARVASVSGPLVVAAILLALVFALARNIAGRLADVSAGADALAAGDLARRVSEAGNDEIARLGRAFNTMAARLEETTLAETRRREALQSAVERCSVFSAKVAAGDLTARISPDGDGDLNRLYDNLNGMVADLGE
ncbi:MAG: CHASE3 domain-containing protein, partial [Actinobacteria bacterium]|nr:CHASE3 domain-containing protein [Actinomycetota bacterium]